MKRFVALGVLAVLALAAFGARPAAAASDRLGPFLGEFQGQSGQTPGSLYTPLWSKPTPFDLAVERHNDELIFAVGGFSSVIMRFVPISDRLYVLRTNQGGAVKESGFAWVESDRLTIERKIERPGEASVGMRFVVSWEDDHRRLTAYTLKGDDEVEVLDTALKGAED
ncbi:MAG: hypothetical protein JWO51_263 [Rhodospirillales bacterium]|nr:hypothetical protein [Rhodospirillales bacterium]